MAPPVAGYTGWWDASQISGVADGAKLSSWPDLSGNGHHLAQATGANQPTYYKTTVGQLVNSQPVVVFDGAASGRHNNSIRKMFSPSLSRREE